jgi:hypothetical protein
MTGDPVGADFCEKCLLSELCSIDPAALSTPPTPCQCAELREALENIDQPLSHYQYSHSEIRKIAKGALSATTTGAALLEEVDHG